MNKITRIKSILQPKFLLLVLLLTGLILAGCTTGGSVSRGWSGVTVANGTLVLGSMDGRVVAVNTANGSLDWSVSLKSPVSGGGGFGCAQSPAKVVIYGAPVVQEGVVYVGGYIDLGNNVARGRVYAYKLGGDKPIWVYPDYDRDSVYVLDEPIVGGLLKSQSKIYFASTDGKIYALDAADGRKVWEFPPDSKLGKVWSAPFVEGDTLYIASFDKKLYALDANSGSKKWEFKTEGAIVSPPVIDGGAVYFGSLDRYFYALNAADGSLKWKFMGGKWFWAKPLVREGVVYAANLDGKVYALEAQSGQKRVEFDLGSPSSASPVLVDELLVVATEAGGVYSLDTGSRQQRLLVDLGEKVYASLAASGSKVYIHSDKNKLFEVDARSGVKRELSIK